MLDKQAGPLQAALVLGTPPVRSLPASSRSIFLCNGSGEGRILREAAFYLSALAGVILFSIADSPCVMILGRLLMRAGMACGFIGAGVFMQGLGLLMKALYPASMLSHEAFVAMFLVSAGAMLVGAVLYALTRESRSGIEAGGKSGNQFHHKGASK